MSEHIIAVFPGLRTSSFQVTSPADPTYNCIAWAAGSDAEWWRPLAEAAKTSWPSESPRAITLDAFRRAFATLGYSECQDDSLEAMHEKVALFADSAGRPTHAARQLPTGRWTSKLGQSEDIEHDLRALEGDVYGSVAMMLKRRTGS